MRKIRVVLALSAAAASAALYAAAPAMAQTAKPSGGVEEVVVTAQRRAEVLSKVPESISAFTSERMEQLDVKDFSQLVRFTPGVILDTHSDNISIRGVNSTAGDATTGIYIDDTPIQLRTLGFGSDNTLPAVFDLERVEVLRGPQGTLFGAGSEGGTVRYITPQPSLTDYGVYAKTEISSTEYGAPSYEGGVAVGGPIVDNQLGFRVSGWWRHDGGYIDRVNYLTGATTDANTNRTNTLVMRGAVAWQPTAQLTIMPSVFYQNRMMHNDDEYWVAISNPDNGDYKTGTPELMGNHDRFVLPALKIDYNFGDVELISDTSYFDRKQLVQDYSGTLYNLSYFQQSLTTFDPNIPARSLRGRPLGTYLDPAGHACRGGLCRAYTAAKQADPNFQPTPLLLAGGINLPGFPFYSSQNVITNTQKNFTQEVRLQSTDSNSPLVWVLGAFYTHEDQLSVEEINDPQLPELTRFLWGESMLNVWGEELLPNGDDYINHTLGHEWQLAGFGNVTYAITPELKVQGGLRVAQTHFDFTNFSDGAQNFGPLLGNSGKKDETPITPMGGITWQMNPDDMVYFTVAKGYRIGGANPPFPINACQQDLIDLGISSVPASYNSDTVLSYEAGTKDRFLEGRLQASGSVFYLQWSNIQQSNYLPSCGFKYNTNLGSAESKGFDIQGEWLLTDDFDVDFSLGYIDAHYTTTSLLGTSAVGAVLAEKGDKLPGSPWTFSLGAQYTTNIMDHSSFIRLDYEFASRESGLTPERDPLTSSFDPALLPEPETNVVTVRAGTTFDRLSVSVFADNLLNSHPQLNFTHQDSNTLLFEATTLRPRTIGLTAAYRY
jgi:iron complex outermembrane recepter protein